MEIHLNERGGVWYAASDAYLELFGCRELPTAFLSGTDGADVLRHVKALNPEATVTYALKPHPKS
jgi:hypothetical protein